MEQQTTKSGLELWIGRGAFILFAICATIGYFEVQAITAAIGYLDLSAKWRLGISALAVIPGGLWILALLSFTRLEFYFLKFTDRLSLSIKGLGKWSSILYFLALILYGFLTIGLQPNVATGLFTRIFISGLFSLVGYACLGAILPQTARLGRIIASVLIAAVVYRITLFIPGINNYPFSLGWGESSNIFTASLFLSEKLYGFKTAPPLINPGRALLNSAAFLLPNPQIWINRLWGSLLQAGITAATGVILSRRLRNPNLPAGALFTLWAFIYLFQGPIYFELLLSVLIVVWLFDVCHFWRSLGIVILASLWIGLCRLNWFPMPGLTAVLLYLLETPKQNKAWWRYLWQPAAWAGAGLAAALGSYDWYSGLAGNTNPFSPSYVNSPLLWYRLLPSATDPWGVLPTTLVVALPALILIGIWLAKQGRALNFLRHLGIAAILAVFLVGGIIVSVKIGGGSGIHNLDAFWFLLLIFGSYIYFNRIALDQSPRQLQIPAPLTMALVAVPVLLQLTLNLPSGLPRQTVVDEALGQIRQYVSSAVQEGKQVLFIDNKQLVTFGYFPATPMVVDYETVYMLEMAMSGNRSYYNKFYQDLKSNRFGLIVTYPQPSSLQDKTSAFSEENNAQVTFLGKPLLCYYEDRKTWLNVNVEVFSPRLQPNNCP
jgi:hypothetical protein